MQKRPRARSSAWGTWWRRVARSLAERHDAHQHGTGPEPVIGRREERYAEMVKSHAGTPEEVADYYREISAATYADQIKTPVLLVHGTLDLVAPHDHSQWMYEALVKAGNQRAKLELLRGVGHFFKAGFGGYRHERVVELAASWFADTLK